MGQVIFNPRNATNLAKFQGSFVGVQAGHAHMLGTSVAPTSVFNQAGYTAYQDTNTGYINLQKTGGESLFTGKWYDQNFNINYDVNPNTNTQNTNSSSQNSIYATNSPIYQQTTTTIYGNNSNSNYPWDKGYTLRDASDIYVNGTNSYNSNNSNEPIKTLGKSDMESIFATGKYNSYAEAVYDLEANGYEVDDDAESELGIYTPESENSIKSVMDSLGMSRKEAIEYLGDSIKPTEMNNAQLESAYRYLTSEQGMSHEEALKNLKQAGYAVPKDFSVDNRQFTSGDEQRISEYMAHVGCSREQAIEDMGLTPKHKGAVAGFFDGIGDWWNNNIANPVGGFFSGIHEWLWGK